MPGLVSTEAAQLWKKLRPDGEATEAGGRTEWAEEGREACKLGKELGLAVRGTEPLGPSCDHALPYPRWPWDPARLGGDEDGHREATALGWARLWWLRCGPPSTGRKVSL